MRMLFLIALRSGSTLFSVQCCCFLILATVLKRTDLLQLCTCINAAKVIAVLETKYIKYLFSLIEAFMNGVCLEPKQI